MMWCSDSQLFYLLEAGLLPTEGSPRPATLPELESGFVAATIMVFLRIEPLTPKMIAAHFSELVTEHEALSHAIRLVDEGRASFMRSAQDASELVFYVPTPWYLRTKDDEP